MDKMQPTFTPQNMPITCGGYKGSMPAPFGQGAYQPQPSTGLVMGAQQQTPPMPTGFPTGGTTSPLLPSQGQLPGTAPTTVAPGWTQMPTTVESTLFTPGFLRTQIGKRVRVEFLIGANSMTDRSGTLVAVGASYIIIRLFETDDLMLCDIYSIKFVTFFM